VCQNRFAQSDDRVGVTAAVQTDSTVVRVTIAAFTTSGEVASRGTVDGPNEGGPAVKSAATTLGNHMDAQGVAGATDATSTPDLVSVTVDDANDTVTYTFDENVATFTGAGAGGDPAKFFVYYRNSNGAIGSSSSTTTERSASDQRSVIARFPADVINQSVAGAYVTDSAVGRANGTTAPTVFNQQDEEGIGSSFAAGAYLGPELVSVTTSNTVDIFGNVTGKQVDFVWDEVVSSSVTASTFKIWDQAGTPTVLSSCTRVSTATTTVRCTTAATGAEATAVTNAVLGTVAASAVTGTAKPTVTSGGVPTTVANHEERAVIG